eukprot:87993_1
MPNPQQYIHPIQSAADTIVKNLSKRMDALDKKFQNSQSSIETMSSISSLYDIRIQAIAKVEDYIKQYKDSKDVNSFFEKTVTVKKNIYNYYQLIQSGLNQNIECHNFDLKKLQQDMIECKQQIKALQAKQAGLNQKCMTAHKSIAKCKREQTEADASMNENISIVSEKKTEVQKACCVFLNKLEQAQYTKILKESIYDRVKYFEHGYNKWSVNDLTAWIKFIENGYFDCQQYEPFLNLIAEMNVNGAQITDMNSKLFLKMAGLDSDSQSVLLRNVARITTRVNRNICGFCATNVINTAMVPCGHQYFCYECSRTKS